MTRHIKWFEELRKKDIPLVGGKCANLGEMISQTKVPVPLGFAITVDAYRYYIEENNLQVEIERILMDSDTHNVRLLIEKGEKVRKLITNAKIPERSREEIVEAYKEMGKEMLDKVVESLEEFGEPESPAKLEGRRMILLMNSKS